MAALCMFLHLVVLATLLKTGATQNLDLCPDTILRDKYLQVHGDVCYEFVLYRDRDYAEAKLDCLDKGGNLVMVKSQDIQNYLFGQLKTTYKAEVDTKYIWIGLHDRINEGNYMWEDGTILDYSNWIMPNGPLHISAVNDEDCVAMSPTVGKWDDRKCTGSSSIIHYICEYETRVVTTTTTTATTPTPPTTTTTAAATTTTTPPPTTTTTTPTTTTVTTASTPTTTISTATTTTTTPLPTTTTTTPTTTTATTLMTETPVPTEEPDTTATTATTTTTEPAIATPCPPFLCNLDCGMSGFLRNGETGCSICACDE